MQLLSSSVSTTAYSRAYLLQAWEARVRLQDNERRGFAVYFYLTICSHVEACMAELMERRLIYARSVIQQFRDGNISWPGSTDAPTFPTLPIHETLTSLLSTFDRRIDKASLESLIEHFQDVFSVRLSNVLGEAIQDLKALASLRNVFAHGREIWLRFNRDEENLLSLDQNPLQLPAQRLLAAGILSTLQVDARGHHDFQKTFFSDEAMLYFLRQARDIECKLKAVPAFPPEREYREFPTMGALPDLTA